MNCYWLLDRRGGGRRPDCSEYKPSGSNETWRGSGHPSCGFALLVRHRAQNVLHYGNRRIGARPLPSPRRQMAWPEALSRLEAVVKTDKIHGAGCHTTRKLWGSIETSTVVDRMTGR
jgi:hypothetical protein